MLEQVKNRFNSHWAFLLGLIIVLILTLNITGSSLEYFPGDLGDARFNNYILEHDHQYFTGEVDSYWNAGFMYPEEDVITYSDNLLGTAPFYSAFRLVGFDRETSFQFWYILITLLNFSACFLFLKWYFKNNYAAVIGALVFAISLALQSQLTHAQMFPRFPIPIAFLMCFLFLKELKPIYFFGAVLAVVYQFYCAIYLGFFLMIPIVILLSLGMIQRRKNLVTQLRSLKWLSKMSASLFLNAMILYPLMQPYFLRSKLLPKNSYESVLASIPTLKSFFYSQPGSFLWSSLDSIGSKYPASWDHQIFTGGIAMLSLFIFGVIVIRKLFLRKGKIKPIETILFFTFSLTFLFFVRFQGHSLYSLLFHIPGFSSLRSLTRIINVELLFFAFSTGYVANLLFIRFKKFSPILFVLIVSFIVVDNYFDGNFSYRTEKIKAQERVDSLVVKMKNVPENSVVSYEPRFLIDPSFVYQIDAMLASQELNFKSINGYTSTSPVEYGGYWWEMDEKTRKLWLKEKKRTSEKIYVIH